MTSTTREKLAHGGKMRSGTISRPHCRMSLSTAAVIAGVAAMHLVACKRPPLTEEERPWEKGRPVSDVDMEEILKPDRPVQSAGLYVGTDGRTYYVARLEERSSIGYLRKYALLVQSRGFLTRPYVTSPHELPPRTLGYDFLVFKKGRIKPFTLLYRQFRDRDPRWTQGKTLRNFPEPFGLDGRVLTVRLGFNALRPWQESILVPDEDAVQVKEFPFPRFPGSVIAGAGPTGAESSLLHYDRTDREYVTRAESLRAVLEHYKEFIRAYGKPFRAQDPEYQLSWRIEPPVDGITRITVRRAHVVPVSGAGLTLEELKESVPSLLIDYPKDVVAFTVLLNFADVESASAFWSSEAQARRKALMTEKEGVR